MGQTKDEYSNDNYSVIGDEDEEEFLDFECENDASGHGGPAIISAPFPFYKGQPQSVLVGASKTDSITIINTTESPLELWRIRIRSAIPDGSYALSLTKPPSSAAHDDIPENTGYLECQSLEDRVLQPRQTLRIWLTCKPKEIGLHHAILNFDVEDDRIERLAFLLADDNHSLALASNKPFSRRGKKKQHFSYERFVKAPSVPRPRPPPPFRFFLPDFSIPQNLRELILDKKVPSAVINKLTYENYVDFFSQLLMVEEINLEEEMRQYDLEHVTMKKKGNYLTLQVLGLAEKRPSLVSGDFVYVKMIDEPDDGGLPFQGSIHRVEADEVFLNFAKEFYRAHSDETMYNVTFAYNRVTMRRRYQAISAAKKNLDPEFLFPSDSGRVIKNFNCVYNNRNLNEEQMTSVAMILGCKGAPPYVVHGPPGTGKTMTLVEAILQLYKSNRGRKVPNILVCAASNSAADHVLDKLMPFVKETEIFRLNATSRSYEDVQPEILGYCFLDEMVFKCPPLIALLRYKIIISTYMSASLLYTEGIRRGHFTHIFLDEVGQASEPEAMIPLANLCFKETVVVLAGDPMQLGPVIYSKEADGFGLGKSYLERLFDFQPYYSGNENFVTKLVRNYRCHPSILKLPSELFYKGELMACKQETDLPLNNWRVLPLKDFPVLFCGIQGCDEREGSNPSWFNRIEASKVVEMIRKLTEIPDLREEDIGVITPYRQQVLKIKKALESLGLVDVKVGSVEQFQGQERRVIIISTVRSTVKHNDHDSRYCLGFLTNPRRFNVAITRAKSLLIVVGNPHIITNDLHWGLFIKYCMENGSYIGCSFTPPVSDVSGNSNAIEVLNGSSFEESRQENRDRISPNVMGSDVMRSDEWEYISTGVDIFPGKGYIRQRPSNHEADISSCVTRKLVLHEKAGMPVVPTMSDVKKRAWKSEGAGFWESKASSEVDDSGRMPWQVKNPEPYFDENKWGDFWETNVNSEVDDSGRMPWQVKNPEPGFDENKWGDFGESNFKNEVDDSGRMPWQVKIPEPCFDENEWGDGWR